jgi:peptidoglycan/LPS O-acetylase OafA/YrhL
MTVVTTVDGPEIASPRHPVGQPSLPATRIRELDGLRGIAILTVLTYHDVWLTMTIPESAVARFVVRLGLMGWAGVDLFFVLSGFLIGGIVLSSRHSPRYYQTFYARRACRILPPYIALLALTAVGAVLLPAAWAPLVDQAVVPWLGYATFTQNIWMALGSGYGAIALAATWSLGVEEQFYLLLPVLVRHVRERWLPWALVLCIIGAPLVRRELLIHGMRLGAYVLLPTRADALAWGVLAAWALRRNDFRLWCVRLRVPLLVLLAILILGLGGLAQTSKSNLDRATVYYGYTWIAVAAAVAIVVAVTQPDSWVARVLRARVLCAWGEIAYGVYLIHVGLYWAVTRTALSPAIATVLALALTWSFARISWTWLESPIVRLGRRLTAENGVPSPTAAYQPGMSEDDLSTVPG